VSGIRLAGLDGPAAVAELAGGVVVVGCGLIGTSLGLALRAAGVPTYLRDSQAKAAALAEALGAGTTEPAPETVALVVACVPPVDVASVIRDAERLFLSASMMDVASVKSHVQVQIEEQADARRFVGGHPMAGRERSGAAVARADLFQGRPWILTPSPYSDLPARRRAEALVLVCGAEPAIVDVQRHDLAVALISHAPQVVASVMAAVLAPADDDLVALAGPGVRDVTRIAASDPVLWTEILTANAAAVLPVLDSVAAELDLARVVLREASSSAGGAGAAGPLTDLLARGGAGRARLPGKHGGTAAAYASVPVVVTDQPGQLAALFAATDAAGVNIEDVRIEHAAGHPVGVVELFVRPEAVGPLVAALRASQWSVHS
jgi:prephenate dehydrogenase